MHISMVECVVLCTLAWKSLWILYTLSLQSLWYLAHYDDTVCDILPFNMDCSPIHFSIKWVIRTLWGVCWKTDGEMMLCIINHACWCIVGRRNATISGWTHWSQDKMDVILQTTFLNQFPWRKFLHFDSISLRVQLPDNSLCFSIAYVLWTLCHSRLEIELIISYCIDKIRRHWFR